jgi:hypothetical protein
MTRGSAFDPVVLAFPGDKCRCASSSSHLQSSFTDADSCGEQSRSVFGLIAGSCPSFVAVEAVPLDPSACAMIKFLSSNTVFLLLYWGAEEYSSCYKEKDSERSQRP